MRFYLGTHRPNWLRSMEVPLFISASTVGAYAPVDWMIGPSLPGNRGGDLWPLKNPSRATWTGAGLWAFDSGAYMANNPRTGPNPDHPWHQQPDVFGGMVSRIIESTAIPPAFAAPQDWPCEGPVRAVTGFSVYQHQELTLENFVYLAEQFYFVPWAPVLQGWDRHEYIRHIEMYEQAGVCLADFDTVGLGSVCRRGRVREIVALVEAVQTYALQRYGKHLPLHGFGMEIRALRRVAHLLSSSDSLSWSIQARNDQIRLPDCTHRSQYCNNCPDYALQWYWKVQDAIEAPKQLSFDLIA